MRKRSKVNIFMACAVLFWDRTEGPTSEQLAVITEPLHAKIKDLEAKYEMLNAATEYYRVSADSLSQNLEQEQSRRDNLERTIVEDKNRCHREISSWQGQLKAAEAKYHIMESEYQQLFWDEKAKASYHEQELFSKDSEILQLTEKLAALQNSLVHGEVYTTSNKENPKQSASDPFVNPTSASRAREWEGEYGWDEVGTRFVSTWQASLAWFKENVAPKGRMYLGDGYSMIIDVATTRVFGIYTRCFEWVRHNLVTQARVYSLGIVKTTGKGSSRPPYQTAKVFLSRILLFIKSSLGVVKKMISGIESGRIRAFLIPIIQVLSKIGYHISKTLCSGRDLVWVNLSAHLKDTQIAVFVNVWRSLQTMHQLVVVVFEWFAVAASCFFVRGLNGSGDHWFYRACLSVKMNCGSILVMLEVLAGLAAMELSLATLHTNRQSKARATAKSRGHQIAVSMSGSIRTTASRARSSGGAAPSENSFRSLYSLSYD